MNEIEALKARVSELENDVKGLRAALEHVALMITRYGLDDPGPADGEPPLRDRVEELEDLIGVDKE